MEAGIKNEKSIVVTEDVTASKVGSGLLPVYATPSMIALMEGTCAESVQSDLAEGEGTVGVSVDIKHIAATPIGMKVRCESLFTQPCRRASGPGYTAPPSAHPCACKYFLHVLAYRPLLDDVFDGVFYLHLLFRPIQFNTNVLKRSITITRICNLHEILLNSGNTVIDFCGKCRYNIGD